MKNTFIIIYRLISEMTVDFAEHGLDKINTQVASYVQDQPRNLKNKKMKFSTLPYLYTVIHILKQFLHVFAQRIYFYRLVSSQKVDFAVTGQYQCSYSTFCSKSIPKLNFSL